MEQRAEAEKEGADGRAELRQLADIERRYKGNVKRYEMAYLQLEWLDQDDEGSPLCHCEFAAREKVELDRFHNLCFREHAYPYGYDEADEMLAKVFHKWSCHIFVLIKERIVKEIEILRGNKRTSTLFGLNGIVLCGRCIFDAWVKFIQDKKRGFAFSDRVVHEESEESEEETMAFTGGAGGGKIFNLSQFRQSKRADRQKRASRRL